MIRPVTLLQSIVLSTALLIGGLTSAALAVSTTKTVVWKGDDSFNDEKMTFDGFWSNQLTDITGFGRYEACCKDGPTNFKLQLRIGQDKNKEWKTILEWAATGDELTHLLDDLVPKVIKFSDKPVYISGIRLSSDPNGKAEYGKGDDPNFTHFDFVTYMSRDEYYEKNKYKYSSRKEYDDCDDYEHYVRKITSFIFDKVSTDGQGEVPIPTPLPAALPLMGSVLGGFGFAMWRRRRKKGA